MIAQRGSSCLPSVLGSCGDGPLVARSELILSSRLESGYCFELTATMVTSFEYDLPDHAMKHYQ